MARLLMGITPCSNEEALCPFVMARMQSVCGNIIDGDHIVLMRKVALSSCNDGGLIRCYVFASNVIGAKRKAWFVLFSCEDASKP